MMSQPPPQTPSPAPGDTTDASAVPPPASASVFDRLSRPTLASHSKVRQPLRANPNKGSSFVGFDRSVSRRPLSADGSRRPASADGLSIKRPTDGARVQPPVNVATSKEQVDQGFPQNLGSPSDSELDDSDKEIGNADQSVDNWQLMLKDVAHSSPKPLEDKPEDLADYEAKRDAALTGKKVLNSTLRAPTNDKRSEKSAEKEDDFDQGKDAPAAAKTKVHNKKKSYASAATAAPHHPDLFASGFTAIRPVKQGNIVSINIPDSIYQEQLNSFRYSIIGRMMHKKGDKPLPPADLKSNLQRLFNFSKPWSLISMGKGFFTLKFECDEDLRCVSKFSFIRCAVGVMYLREWTPDFDPSFESSSAAHIWVKVYHLPAFYWHPEVLTGLLSAAGTVIKLDGNTMSGAFGQFARALVEIDLAQPLLDEVRVGCGSNSFSASLVYENLPPFCSHCSVVGHTLDRCRHAQQEPVKESVEQPKVNVEKAKVTQEWVEMRDRRRQHNHKNTDNNSNRRRVETEVPTNNAFAALGDDGEEQNNHDMSYDASDILDRITVPVEDYDKAVKACSPEVQQELANIDQQLKRLEQKMQAERRAKDLGSKPSRVGTSRGGSTSLVPFQNPPSYETLQQNLANSAAEAADGLRLVHDKLTNASLLGAKPTDFSVVREDEDMNMVAAKKWADDVEKENSRDTSDSRRTLQ